MMRACPSIHGPKEGPLLGANGPAQAQYPFEPSSRLLLAAYRGSVSDFAVSLVMGMPAVAFAAGLR